MKFVCKKGFTLIELLTVIAIITLLISIMMPAFSRAKMQCRILTVNSDLKQIGLALETYALNNDGQYPPTRQDCQDGKHTAQIPDELVDGGYLGNAKINNGMSSDMQDPFNPDCTYKYMAVGEIIVDRGKISNVQKSELWVPDGFPNSPSETGRYYSDPRKSPVTWVTFSNGPQYDPIRMKQLHYPVPKQTWYDSDNRAGLLVRMRLLKGDHIGTFSGD